MHGCSDAVLVYGFNIGNRNFIIDYDYLADVFPDISQYAGDVVRNYLGEAIYGISCEINKNTGQAIISDENKEKVKKLYDKYIEYLNKHMTQKELKKKKKEIQLCFCLAVSGDYETCQKSIILDDDYDKYEDDDGDDDEDDIMNDIFGIDPYEDEEEEEVHDAEYND